MICRGDMLLRQISANKPALRRICTSAVVSTKETPVTMSMQMDRIGSRPTGTNHDNVCPSTTSGMDYLRNPRLFKGMGFALDERQALGIHGLLPPRVKSQAEQTDNCLRNIRRYKEPLNQYLSKRSVMYRY
jgi:malate dehydrogenase (oxaloacetate-decarboxylating)(NADP+)